MRLVRYAGGRIGVLRDNLVHDVTSLAGIEPEAWPSTGMLQLIKNFDSLRPKLENADARPGA
ncbi:MAG: fumarylacetoacetate hydrolase family protein, partial [Terriglobia bacterium]